MPGELLWHCLSVEVDVRALPRKGKEMGLIVAFGILKVSGIFSTGAFLLDG